MTDTSKQMHLSKEQREKAQYVVSLVKQKYDYGTDKQPRWFRTAVVSFSRNLDYVVKILITDWDDVPAEEVAQISQPMHDIELVVEARRKSNSEPSCPLPNRDAINNWIAEEFGTLSQVEISTIELTADDIMEMSDG